MKKLCIPAFLFMLFTAVAPCARATSYYFSSAGDDAQNGRLPSTAWKSLSKIGDLILSHRNGADSQSEGPAVSAGSGDITGIRVYNNIFYLDSLSRFVRFHEPVDIAFNHNVYFSTLGFRITEDTDEFYSLADWQSTTGQETLNGGNTGTTTDPKLRSPGNGGTVDNPNNFEELTAYQLSKGTTLINRRISLGTFRPAEEEVRFDFYGGAIDGYAAPGVDDSTEQVIPSVFFSAGPTCLGSLTKFTSKITDADSFRWNFGDSSSSTQESPTHLYKRAGNFTVSLTGYSYTGDSSVFTQQLIVNPRPKIKGLNRNVACLNDFSYQSIEATGATSFYTDYGDGHSDTGQFNSHQYAAPGVYLYKVVAYSAQGCTDTLLLLYNVEDIVDAGFTYIDGGAKFTFIPKVNFVISSTWNFGDQSQTSQQGTVSHVYRKTGTYYVTRHILSQNNCGYSATAKITVTTTGISESEPVELTLSPNPFTSQASVSWQGAEASSAVLMDAQGRVVRRYTAADLGAGGRELQISGDGLLPGVYLLRVLGSTVLGSVTMVRE